MMGEVYLHKSDYRSGENVSLMFLNGKLYCRSSEVKPAPFVLLNPVTLEEEKTEEKEDEVDKEGQTLAWAANEDTGRSLEFTPLITDGQLVYVIALQKTPKKSKHNKCN